MCWINDIDILNMISTHFIASAHDVIVEMCQNSIQYHGPPDDSYLLCCLA